MSWEKIECLWNFFKKTEPEILLAKSEIFPTESEIGALKAEYLKLELEIWAIFRDWAERGLMHFRRSDLLPPYREVGHYKALLHQVGSIRHQLHRAYEKSGMLNEYYAFLEQVKDEREKLWPQ